MDRVWSVMTYLCDFPFFLAALKKAKLTSILQTKYPTEQKIKNGMCPHLSNRQIYRVN